MLELEAFFKLAKEVQSLLQQLGANCLRLYTLEPARVAMQPGQSKTVVLHFENPKSQVQPFVLSAASGSGTVTSLSPANVSGSAAPGDHRQTFTVRCNSQGSTWLAVRLHEPVANILIGANTPRVYVVCEMWVALMGYWQVEQYIPYGIFECEYRFTYATPTYNQLYNNPSCYLPPGPEKIVAADLTAIPHRAPGSAGQRGG